MTREKIGLFKIKGLVIFIFSMSTLILVAIVATGIGSVYIKPVDVINTFLFNRDKTSMEYIIVFNMRMARVLASIAGGACLALSGLLLQILFSNPIADPYVLGVSSGARLFVGLTLLGGITFGVQTLRNPWFMFLGALAGAMTIMIIMLLFATRIKQITTLLIIGIMLGYLCSAIIGVLVAMADDHSIADFMKWNMGSFGLITWKQIQVLITIALLLFFISIMISKKLNALLMGEEYAKTMGVNTKVLRIVVILVSSMLTAVVTAFAGLIAFVGMSVPHIARLIFKTTDARVLIPATIILGGLFGVACDLIARTIVSPNELAVGTVTSFVGVPIILSLLIRKNRQT